MENKKLRVLCIDTPANIGGKSLFKCLGPVMDWLRSREDVEYRYNLYADPDLLAWADVIIVSPCEYASILASKRRYDDSSFHHWNDAENRFGPGGFRDWSKAKLIIQGVDIDLICGHWRGVSWGKVDHFVTISEHGLEIVKKEAQPGQIDQCPDVRVIPIGMDMSKWTFREREGHGAGRIAWAGESWAAKNPALAVLAFKDLLDVSGENLTLHMLGRKSGDSKWIDPHLESLIDDLRIRERVFLTDTVDDVDAWLEDKDFLLHTSSKEEFSLITAEAAAKGLQPLTHVFPGARNIWPDSFLWGSLAELRSRFRSDITSSYNRAVVENRYGFDRVVRPVWETIIFGENA